MTGAPSGPRRPLFRLLSSAAIVLLSVAVVVDHVRLTREIASRQADDLHPQVNTVGRRVTALEQAQATREKRPVSATAHDLEATAHALGDRITALEQAAHPMPDVSDLPSLRDRISALEARQKAAAVAPLAHPARTKRIAARPPMPPFGLLGLERRAGETFLAIAPSGASSLGQLQLLRTGDAVGEWTLVAVDGSAAVFHVHGTSQRLPIP